MVTGHDDWTVYFGVPRGAVVLPVHDEPDPGPWARKAARGQLGPETPDELVDDLADALTEATLDARMRNPVSAFFFCPDPTLGELARIEVSNLDPDDELPEVTVERMAEFLATPTERSVNRPETEYGDLPIGPAVRVCHQYVDRGMGPAADAGGPGTILQTCAYAARPPEIGSAVLLMVSWRALAYSDELFDLTDRLAQALRLVRRSVTD